MKLQKTEERQCLFVGCGNMFIGPPQQKYCMDQKCVEARKILAQKNRKPKVDEDVTNLTLAKGKFANGTILNIQCAASGPAGRCTHKFVVMYDPGRTVYPLYCETHRNAYQRARFEGKI